MNPILKEIAKWLLVAQIATLCIFPFFGGMGEGFSAVFLFVSGMFWYTFAAPGVAWLWLILIISGPVVCYIFRNKNDLTTWIIKVSTTFTAFLGSLLFGIISPFACFGTWIFMVVTIAYLVFIILEGLPLFNKK